jgi:hypothetical protein
MGQRVYIKAKTEAVKKLNSMLVKAKIKNSFITEQDTIDWLKDINYNPKSPQAHLKPENHDLTLDELKKMFPCWTEVGLLSFDVAFSRTSEEEAKKYAKFIEANKDSLEYIKGGDSFIERFDLTTAQSRTVTELEQPEPELEELPKEEQTNPDIQGGLFLCKSWSPKPFWLIFGNVERPVFLKVKKYKDDLNNRLYYDKAGYAYLMIPLLPLFHNGDKQVDFVVKVYNEAAQMGLRENFNFIIPIVYGLDLTNYEDAAKDYLEHYSIEELKERFVTLFKYTASVYPYGYCSNGFVWRDDKKRFKPTGGNGTFQILSRCSVLTALLRAMGQNAAAEVMTETTETKHLAFEFK